jgi:hypothetical protein
MKNEENTQFNTGIADVGAAWMIAIAMLVVLLAWSFA